MEMLNLLNPYQKMDKNLLKYIIKKNVSWIMVKYKSHQMYYSLLPLHFLFSNKNVFYF